MKAKRAISIYCLILVSASLLCGCVTADQYPYSHSADSTVGQDVKYTWEDYVLGVFYLIAELYGYPAAMYNSEHQSGEN